MLRKDTNGKLVLIGKAVQEVWKEIPIDGEFHGWELQQKCIEKHPELKNVYTDTFLRRLREYYSGCYILKSRSESLYQKTSKAEYKRQHVLTQEEKKKYMSMKQQSFDFGEN